MKLTQLAVTVALLILIVSPATEIAAAEGQLGAPIEWIPVPDDPDRFWMAQKTPDGRLILTPNEAFFPKLGLKAEGESTVDDVATLNGGKSFAEIRGWSKGEQTEWGLWFPRRGQIQLTVSMDGGGQFSLSLGEQVETIAPGRPMTFQVDAPGKQSLRLTSESRGKVPAFRRIEITGDAAKGAAVIRKRWRPAAAHTKFWSSSEPKAVRLWIMEMDASPGELGFYSPVTTPFGYYGPTWNADGTVNTGFNFSLWSYGRNQPEPPVEQLSHLIAIGNRDATFGGFGHEGTGVKIRNWKPLKGRQGQRQAFALRVEPGAIYDTYYSYFFATDENRWQLFGAGKKFNKSKPIKSLWVGSFVEVPGPPHVQRTGLNKRHMRYRGWVIDANNRWYPLDRMGNGNIDRKTGFTHTDRGVTSDGWFFMQTGGWTFRKPPHDGKVVLLDSPTAKSQVDYLDPNDLEFLTTVPCAVTATTIERKGDFAQVSFNIRNAGKNPEVTIYWGRDEGLTFFDRWKHKAKINNPREGANQHVIRGISPKETLRVRLFLKNAEGQFWSSETLTAAP